MNLALLQSLEPCKLHRLGLARCPTFYTFPEAVVSSWMAPAVCQALGEYTLETEGECEYTLETEGEWTSIHTHFYSMYRLKALMGSVEDTEE